MKNIMVLVSVLFSCSSGFSTSIDVEETEEKDECPQLFMRWERPPEYPLPVNLEEEFDIDLSGFDGFIEVTEDPIDDLGIVFRMSETGELPMNTNSMTWSFNIPYISEAIINSDIDRTDEDLRETVFMILGSTLGVRGVQTCNIEEARIFMQDRSLMDQFIEDLRGGITE
jgi:hypothetical protein